MLSRGQGLRSNAIRGVMVLVAVVGAVFAPAAAAAAPDELPRYAQRIADQCGGKSQPGVLTTSHSDKDLRRTLDILRELDARHQRCWNAISSQLAGRHAKQAPSGQILDDCIRHRGALTRRYSTAGLQRALRKLKPEIRDGTHCAAGIASQLNGRKGVKRARIARQRKPKLVPGTPASLIDTHQILRRPPTTADQPSTELASILIREAAQEGFTTDAPLHARRVAGLTGFDLFVLPSPAGRLCVTMQFARLADGEPDNPVYLFNCVLITDPVSANIVRVPGGWLTLSLLPDGYRDPWLVNSRGAWAQTELVDGLVATILPNPPRLLRVTAPSGRRQYVNLQVDW